MHKPKEKQNASSQMMSQERDLSPARYDVRLASQSFSNIGAFMSGFALTSIILIFQSNNNASSTIKDLSLVAFIIAFFGSLLSALIFGVINGEEREAPFLRQNTMAMLGGVGFFLSFSYIIWGVATLTEIYSPDIAIFIKSISLLILIILPSFFSSIIWDMIKIVNGTLSLRDELKVLGWINAPFLLLFLSFLKSFQFYFLQISIFLAFSYSIILIVITFFWTLIISYKKSSFWLGIKVSELVICSCSFATCYLILNMFIHN